ncbi:putative ankyrin repeat protein RF_0381 [Ptychodera flava]|uniref:putative ankyrin repeat protein RF_0381 n=1 Tax=Ptychodera flava TaxID=63121 RepID=UPI00396A0D9F
MTHLTQATQIQSLRMRYNTVEKLSRMSKPRLISLGAVAKEWSTLYLAVREESVDMVDLIASKASNINMEFDGTEEEREDSYYSLTSLGYAVKSGSQEMVKCLLEKGADVNNGGEWPPLYIAVREAKFDLVPLLLSHNAEVNELHEDRGYRCGCTNTRFSTYEDCEYLTSLGYAVESGSQEMVKCLLEKGADVNNGGHWSPLHIAVREDKFDIVQLLLTYNPDVDALAELGDDYCDEYSSAS